MYSWVFFPSKVFRETSSSSNVNYREFASVSSNEKCFTGRRFQRQLARFGFEFDCLWVLRYQFDEPMFESTFRLSFYRLLTYEGFSDSFVQCWNWPRKTDKCTSSGCLMGMVLIVIRWTSNSSRSINSTSNNWICNLILKPYCRMDTYSLLCRSYHLRISRRK